MYNEGSLPRVSKGKKAPNMIRPIKAESNSKTSIAMVDKIVDLAVEKSIMLRIDRSQYVPTRCSDKQVVRSEGIDYTNFKSNHPELYPLALMQKIIYKIKSWRR